MRVAVIGLGEAGGIYATDLVARGVSVTGTDLRRGLIPPGVHAADDVPGTVAGAELVLSLVGASSADQVLDQALPAMSAEGIYVDMNTSGAEEKRRLAERALARGIPFVDAAIMAPVPRARSATPLLLSGPGAGRVLPLLERLGMPSTDVGDEPGAAARLKLLRSVFMKGLAAVVVESVRAAERVGAQDWVIDQIASELGASGREAVEHLLSGTIKHAVRREAEMIQARDLLASMDAAHPMTDGTIAWLRAIAGEGARDART
jgi:3-hydroxyisobutyrate dehydrogenase-like beta-hydroxyacid dehydrogenase